MIADLQLLDIVVECAHMHTHTKGLSENIKKIDNDYSISKKTITPKCDNPKLEKCEVGGKEVKMFTIHIMGLEYSQQSQGLFFYWR